MKKYNQLSRAQRYAIQIMLKMNKSYNEIASFISVHKSTVSREIKRNKWDDEYSGDLAHKFAKDRRDCRVLKEKFTPEMKQEVRRLMIEEQWSPEQIVGRCRLENKPMVGKSTIYSFLHCDKEAGGDLYTYTRHSLKYRKKRLSARTTTRWGKRRSIEERPDEINKKERIGDWEMDLIIGKNRQDAILTLVERITGFAIIQKLPQGKKAKPLAKLAIKRLRHLNRNNKIRSITTDNGAEFTAFKKIECALKIKVYFAKPYCSSDKPHIEYLNKLIRQYIPKGSSFKNLTDEDIKQIEHKLNNRPREKLNFKTPRECFLLS